jgi:hypothetical protein
MTCSLFTPTVTALTLLVFTFGLSGCATLGPTSAQQSARTAWDGCPKSANLALTSIDADGLVRYRAMSGPAGARELAQCLEVTGVPSALTVAAAP